MKHKSVSFVKGYFTINKDFNIKDDKTGKEYQHTFFFFFLHCSLFTDMAKMEHFSVTDFLVLWSSCFYRLMYNRKLFFMQILLS